MQKRLLQYKETMKKLNKTLENASPYANESCEKCAKEHEQLAEWLEELKQYRDTNSICIHLDADSDEVKRLLHDAYSKALDDLMTKLDCDKYLLNEWQRDVIKDKVKELKAGGGDISH